MKKREMTPDEVDAEMKRLGAIQAKQTDAKRREMNGPYVGRYYKRRSTYLRVTKMDRFGFLAGTWVTFRKEGLGLTFSQHVAYWADDECGNWGRQISKDQWEKEVHNGIDRARIQTLV